jgi:hypothetical protein
LDDPLVVRVTDSDSRPVPGVAVVFRFQSDVPGAEVYPEEEETNLLGEASARVRLGEVAGSQKVDAELAQVAAPNLRATFDLTALADEKEKKDKDREDRGGDDDDDDDDDD